MLKLCRLNGLCDGPAVCSNGKLMGGEKGIAIRVGVLWLLRTAFFFLFFLIFDFLGCIAGEGT